MQLNNPSHNKEVQRVREEYTRRTDRFAERDTYSALNLSHLFAIHHRQRVVARMLNKAGYTSLNGLRILEIGCGGGDVLHELMAYRINANSLYGVDLIPERVKTTKDRFPFLSVIVADGQALPYANQSFDLIMQSMVFSSVLDENIRVNIADEMRRVLSPNGSIIWYDFWTNPLNKQTRGVRPIEIRKLFIGYQCIFQRVTLAPPIARRLVPYSWLLAEILERVRLLNTHYVAIIKSP